MKPLRPFHSRCAHLTSSLFPFLMHQPALDCHGAPRSHPLWTCIFLSHK